MDKDVMAVRLEKWKTILAVQAQSGMSKKEWCVQNNIPTWEFFEWQSRIRRSILSDTKSINHANESTLPSVRSNVSTDVAAMSETEFVELSFQEEGDSFHAPAQGHSSTVRQKKIKSGMTQELPAMDISYHGISIHLGATDEAGFSALLRVLRYAD